MLVWARRMSSMTFSLRSPLDAGFVALVVASDAARFHASRLGLVSDNEDTL